MDYNISEPPKGFTHHFIETPMGLRTYGFVPQDELDLELEVMTDVPLRMPTLPR